MTIIRLDEEGFPRRNKPTFPAWLIAAHVAAVGFASLTLIMEVL